MDPRRLGKQGLTVSPMGLGCMGMSDAYGPADEVESVATIHRALDLGINLLDTSDAYGPFIPGTKRRKNLEENVAALAITLTREDLQRIDEAAPKGAASGERYEDMSVVDR
jgi:aryl-alcohol dehydrogenase-like predicted oxidoreductase